MKSQDNRQSFLHGMGRKYILMNYGGGGRVLEDFFKINFYVFKIFRKLFVSNLIFPILVGDGRLWPPLGPSSVGMR